MLQLLYLNLLQVRWNCCSFFGQRNTILVTVCSATRAIVSRRRSTYATVCIIRKMYFWKIFSSRSVEFSLEINNFRLLSFDSSGTKNHFLSHPSNQFIYFDPLLLRLLRRRLAIFGFAFIYVHLLWRTINLNCDSLNFSHCSPNFVLILRVLTWSSIHKPAAWFYPKPRWFCSADDNFNPESLQLSIQSRN